MRGVYTLPAIPPYCQAKRVAVEVVRCLGHRVLLRELDNPNMMIDSDLAAFEPDLEAECHIGKRGVA